MTEKVYDFTTIKAIVGLGNPGNKFVKTRHNIGFRVVDLLVDRYHGSWSSADLLQYAQIQIFDENSSLQKVIHIVKPLTFMNMSGKAIPFLLKKGIGVEEILVVHDELEKRFSTMSIRWGGSARGHNGLRSIQSVIGKDFWRLRFGISRPADKNEVGDYVLSPFDKDEVGQVDILIEQAIDMIIMSI